MNNFIYFFFLKTYLDTNNFTLEKGNNKWILVNQKNDLK
jgi:hypothetical protein